MFANILYTLLHDRFNNMPTFGEILCCGFPFRYTKNISILLQGGSKFIASTLMRIYYPRRKAADFFW